MALGQPLAQGEPGRGRGVAERREVLERIGGLEALALPHRRRAIRSADATQGRTAGHLAARTGSALLAYSYFAYDAFRAYGGPGILFQVHPHPATIRRILSEELAMHPDCAASLQQPT